MMMSHPFMPDLNGKSLDELIKEMNDIYVKMRGCRNPALLGQMQMVLQGYQEQYQKRMSEEMTRTKDKKKSGKTQQDD